MLHKIIIVYLLFFFIIPIFVYPQSESLVQRCRTALALDINDKRSRKEFISLIDEIESKENLYLKSALYPDVREYYEKLHVKLGEYYARINDHERAIDYFKTADKYSSLGYQEKIATSRKLLEEIRLTKLHKLMHSGGKSLNNLRKILRVNEKYEDYFKKKSPWNSCITLLKKYYQSKENQDYPELLALYEDPSNNIKNSCSDVLEKWGVMKKEEVEKKYRDYFEKQVSTTLTSKGNKKRADFFAFEKILIRAADQSWELDDLWQNRYELLKAYFNAPDEESCNNAARDLYARFPELAESYSIPRPYGNNKVYVYTRGKKPGKIKKQGGKKPLLPKSTMGNPDQDYRKLEEMWLNVKGMNTEREVIHYITRKAPLRIKGTNTAMKTLGLIYNRHNNWIYLRDYRRRLKALDMIARMQTKSGNPGKQNEIYQYIRYYGYTKEQLKESDLQDIKSIIKNNGLYMSLLEDWKNKEERGSVYLRTVDIELNYGLLTLEQEIKVHYMLGHYNEKISGGTVPACYHYGRAYRLMKLFLVSKVYLEGNKFLIDRLALQQLMCRYCKAVINSDIQKEFEDRYRGKNLEISTFTGECNGDSSNQ